MVTHLEIFRRNAYMQRDSLETLRYHKAYLRKSLMTTRTRHMSLPCYSENINRAQTLAVWIAGLLKDLNTATVTIPRRA